MSTHDDAVTVILSEYDHLRQEILQKMDSCWKIITFEAGGTSLILGYVFANSQYSLLALVPFLVLVTSFLYMGETLAIINAGNYIHDYTEKNMRKLLGDKLETPLWEDVKRKSNCYMLIHLSTYSLFAGIFWASIAIMIWFKLNPSVAIIPLNWLTILVFTSLYSVGFIVNLHVYIKRILPADKSQCSSGP